MIGTTIHSKFRVHIPRDFILAETRNRFNDYFKSRNELMLDIADFINQSIISGVIPGLSDDGTDEQRSNNRPSRKFKGITNWKNKISKEIDLTFRLREGFFNWIVMYSNFHTFLASEMQYMPDISIVFYDGNDNETMRFKFKEIKIDSISSLDFSVDNNNVNSDTFSMSLSFNDIEFEYIGLKKLYNEKDY